MAVGSLIPNRQVSRSGSLPLAWASPSSRSARRSAADSIYRIFDLGPNPKFYKLTGDMDEIKTGAVLSISRHTSCANGRHLLPHLAVIPRTSREPKDVGRARRSYCL